jgi:hypothetical protein
VVTNDALNTIARRDLVTMSQSGSDVDFDPEEVSTTGVQPRFRKRARFFLLTWPKCDADKEVVADYLFNHPVKNRRPISVAVAQESHQDGSKHLHAVVEFDQKVEVTCCTEFDAAAGKHCNIASKRAIGPAYKYISKEDTKPATRGVDPDAVLAGNSLAKLTAAIQRGADAIDIWRDHPDLILRYNNAITQAILLQGQLGLREKAEAWVAPSAPSDAPPWVLPVYEWLGSAIRTPVRRDLRAPQLWICGPPGCGKTTLGTSLVELLRVYLFPNGEDYHDSYSDKTYDLVILDEMEGKVCSPNQLNRFSDGSPILLKRKGGQVRKTDRLPILVLSNFHPGMCWRSARPESVAAVEDRFVVCAVPQDHGFALTRIFDVAPGPPH